MSESIDDLLNRATGKSTKLRCENDSRVIRYIEKTQLEPGILAVPTYVIYWHYRQVYTYPGLFDQNKAKKVIFFRTFSKRFPQYRKKLQRYYLLNPSQLSDLIEEIDGTIRIKEEVLKTAKAYDKNYGNQKRKKKVRLSEQEGDSPDAT
jgi:hypothetical protein